MNMQGESNTPCIFLFFVLQFVRVDTKTQKQGLYGFTHTPKKNLKEYLI